jgi:predicted DNA-binding helix-hairpin-helix protein
MKMERQTGLPIDINSAKGEELTQLPRVGADTAKHIIHHRALRKGFRDWQDFAETLEIAPEDVAAIRTMAVIGPRCDEQPAREPRRTPRNAQSVRRPHPRSQ